MRRLPTSVLAVLYVLSVWAIFVTVAVTRAQAYGQFQVVIVNNDTQRKHPWMKRTWPNQQTCDAALGNANAVLRRVADPAEVSDANPSVEFDGADHELLDSIVGLILTIYQNTGKMPNFSISCEQQGDPA